MEAASCLGNPQWFDCDGSFSLSYSPFQTLNDPTSAATPYPPLARRPYIPETPNSQPRLNRIESNQTKQKLNESKRNENSPRRLCLWNTKKDHSICEVNFLTAVLSVKLNRKRVAVCLKSALHVFDISDMKCLRTLETAPNPDGVMALSPDEENCYLAFPDGAKAGGAGGGGEVRASCFRRCGPKLAWSVCACPRGRGCGKGMCVVCSPACHLWERRLCPLVRLMSCQNVVARLAVAFVRRGMMRSDLLLKTLFFLPLSWCVLFCGCVRLSVREQVILYNALDLKVLNKVVACRSRVVAVSFSRDGKLLATASEQGTVIRIFTVPSAVKVRCSPA